MKKVCSILFAILLCLTLAVPAFALEVPLLFDGTGLLSSELEQEIQTRLEEFRAQYQVEIAIALVESTEGYGADWFVELYYDQNDLGCGPNRDGVLLVVAMQEREYRILSNGFAADAITMDEIDAIGDSIAEELSAGEYAEAFMKFISLCEYEIDGEINGFPFDFGMSLLVSVVIGLVAALIATGIMAAQLRSVKRRTEAGEYTVPGSVNVTHASDLFLYRTVSRRAKPQQSSGSRGGGGGGRNVGGGRF